MKTADLTVISNAAAAYKRLSNVKAITRAAKQAGEQLKTAMQKTITGESTLRSYQDVADGITVFEDSQNVVVGIPGSSPLLPRALKMDEVYPVRDVVEDLTRQQDDTEEAFNDAMAEVLSR